MKRISQKNTEDAQLFWQRYRDIQSKFIAARGHLKLQNKDIANALGVDQSTVSEAEAYTSQYPFPRYFLSADVISAYCKDDQSRAVELENQSFSTFYPNGIHHLKDLVTYLAYRNSYSLESLGKELGIKGLNHKISPNNNSRLSSHDTLKLRAFIKEKMNQIQFIRLDVDSMETLLPDPLSGADDVKTNFRATLKVWIGLCANDAEAFAALVASRSHQKYSPSTPLSSWAKGIGLAEALPHIIQTLKEEHGTRALFTSEREGLFRAKAMNVIPQSKVRRVTRDLSSSQPNISAREPSDWTSPLTSLPHQPGENAFGLGQGGAGFEGKFGR